MKTGPARIMRSWAWSKEQSSRARTWASKDFMAGMKTLVGGEIVGYTEMVVEARAIATKRMVDEAEALGADAIIGIRYGSSSVMQSAAEVLAYGTAIRFI